MKHRIQIFMKVNVKLFCLAGFFVKII